MTSDSDSTFRLFTEPSRLLAAAALAGVLGSALLVGLIVLRAVLGPAAGWPGEFRLYDANLLALYYLLTVAVMACLTVTVIGVYIRLGPRGGDLAATGVVFCYFTAGAFVFGLAASLASLLNGWAASTYLLTALACLSPLLLIGQAVLGVASLRTDALPSWARPLPLALAARYARSHSTTRTTESPWEIDLVLPLMAITRTGSAPHATGLHHARL